MTRVLILCDDAIGDNMAGPGIRYWEFARVLSQTPGLQVTLAVFPRAPEPVVRAASEFPAQIHRCKNDDEVRALLRSSDVVIVQWALLPRYPFLTDAGVPLVMDAYVPFVLEWLYVGADAIGGTHLAAHETHVRILQHLIRAADFILCASEKQRDYYLGAMSALGRVNPYTHHDDPTLRRLIDVSPFGLPAEPPRHARQVLKGIYPGIAQDDRVLLWGGSILDWFDTPTLIRAMARLAACRSEVKLFFMGTLRPDERVRQHRAVAETISLSQELGVYGRTVFFNEWVPYADRESYLLEADLGVSLHRDHLETRFSFRTRFLDYVWAGLPMVVTRGDVLSDQVRSHGLGRVVEPGDVEGVAQAIVDLLDTPNLREACRARFEPLVAQYRWEVATRPLVEFCASPRFAPDKAYLRQSFRGLGPTPWWGLPGKAWTALRAGGLRGLARQAGEYRRWLLNRRGRR